MYLSFDLTLYHCYRLDEPISKSFITIHLVTMMMMMGEQQHTLNHTYEYFPRKPAAISRIPVIEGPKSPDRTL